MTSLETGLRTTWIPHNSACVSDEELVGAVRQRVLDHSSCGVTTVAKESDGDLGLIARNVTGVEEDQHAGMSDGGDGRKRAKREHAASGKSLTQPPLVIILTACPPAPRAVLALLPLLPPPLKLGCPLLFTLSQKQLPDCALLLGLLRCGRGGDGRGLSLSFALEAWSIISISEHTLVVSAVIVQRGSAVSPGYSTGQELSPQRLTRDDGGKNDLSCFGFWEVWCRATGRKGLRKARNLV
ncbi:hypothetical protein EDB86DRAFT_2835641 [Lactarius hatsudake]|nr:hypothetical protein EDB86DRAFT_2835641 [Lactarius hatsudake]